MCKTAWGILIASTKGLTTAIANAKAQEILWGLLGLLSADSDMQLSEKTVSFPVTARSNLLALARSDLLALARSDLLALARSDLLALARSDLLALARSDLLALARSDLLALARSDLLTLASCCNAYDLWYIYSKSSLPQWPWGWASVGGPGLTPDLHLSHNPQERHWECCCWLFNQSFFTFTYLIILKSVIGSAVVDFSTNHSSPSPIP